MLHSFLGLTPLPRTRTVAAASMRVPTLQCARSSPDTMHRDAQLAQQLEENADTIRYMQQHNDSLKRRLAAYARLYGEIDDSNS